MQTFRDLLPAAALGLTLTVLLAAAVLAPRPGAPVLVLFPPGLEAIEAVTRVAASGLRPIASPRPFIVLAAPGDNRRGWPRGALLEIDALGARGCAA